MSNHADLVPDLDFAATIIKTVVRALEMKGGDASNLKLFTSDPLALDDVTKRLLGDLWMHYVKHPKRVDEIDWTSSTREILEKHPDIARIMEVIDMALDAEVPELQRPGPRCLYELRQLAFKGGARLSDPLGRRVEYATFRELLAYAKKYLRRVETHATYYVVAMGTPMSDNTDYPCLIYWPGGVPELRSYRDPGYGRAPEPCVLHLVRVYPK